MQLASGAEEGDNKRSSDAEISKSVSRMEWDKGITCQHELAKVLSIKVIACSKLGDISGSMQENHICNYLLIRVI